ncbi:hypothetical protein HWV62_16950 [Athelia sp. TMB]|nr:hypothetical protein HWV62_16950 [Athelia sp. TMB]
MPIFNTHNTSGGVVLNAIGNIYYENNNQPHFHLDHVPMARFDCGDRVACTTGTRQPVLERVEIWIDKGPPIFWLNGSAGTGKSTIAFTVAEMFKQKGILGASFFCSRDDAACSNHKLIFPSIAYQLARINPQFAHYVEDIVRKRPEIAHADVAYQLQELIVNPLSKMPEFASRCMVVIDALDECKDDSTISVILAALSRFAEKLLPLKIFLTSRPEYNINLGFRQSGLQAATHKLILHEIALPAVEADIKTYLERELELIRNQYGITELWPSATEIDLLSKLSCGLFIFAATSIKFIKDLNYSNPRGQLQSIITSTDAMKDDFPDPSHRLDHLYLQVLTESHPCISSELAERLRTIIGTIVLLQDPLPLRCIQRLLEAHLGRGSDIHSIRQTLARLHSIILVPEDDGCVIRALHPSLFDFIINPNRCLSAAFRVKPCEQHSTLLVACLRTLKSFKQNVCKLPDPSALHHEVSDLPKTGNARSPAGVLLSDCERFIRAFYPVISVSCAHIYDSALLFSPEHSALRRHYSIHLSKVKVFNRPQFWDACLCILEGHSERVNSLAFSPDGSKIMSGSSDGTIRLWDAVSGAHLNTLKSPGEKGTVISAAFSPDGTSIVSSEDRSNYRETEISLWDATSGAHIMTSKTEGYQSQAVFSPDGSSFFAGSGNGIKQWEVTGGAPANNLSNPNEDLSSSSIAISRDRTIIVACGYYREYFHIWDTTARTHLRIKAVHRNRWDRVTSVAVSPDGAKIASGSSVSTIGIWDALTGKSKMTLQGHCGQVTSVKFSPDGTRLVSASEDSTTRIWDASRGALLHIFTGPLQARSVAFSPDGHRIVSGYGDGTVRVWKYEHDIERKRARHRSLRAMSLLLPDIARTRMLSSCRNANEKFRSSMRVEQRPMSYSLLMLSPDNKTLMTTSELESGIEVWEAVSGLHLKTIKTGSKDLEVSIAPDGSRFMSWKCGAPLQLWNTTTWTVVKVLERRWDQSPMAVTFSPNSARIGTGSKDGTVRLWSPMDGTHIMTLTGDGHDVWSLAFSPDSTTIASVSANETVQLWDVISGLRTNTLQLDGITYNTISFSPDGLYVVVHHRGNQLQLWHISRGEKSKSISWNSEYPALWIPFSPEHADLATGNQTRKWAKPSNLYQKHRYYMQDGWVWLVQPRKRLCWVPVACRGDMVSNKGYVAFNRRGEMRPVVIDFSEIIAALPDG